jgi:hypothetical protein
MSSSSPTSLTPSSLTRRCSGPSRGQPTTLKRRGGRSGFSSARPTSFDERLRSAASSRSWRSSLRERPHSYVPAESAEPRALRSASGALPPSPLGALTSRGLPLGDGRRENVVPPVWRNAAARCGRGRATTVPRRPPSARRASSPSSPVSAPRPPRSGCCPGSARHGSCRRSPAARTRACGSSRAHPPCHSTG